MVDFEALKAPFPADWIDWRVGSTNKDKTKGMALAYIDARSVMDRLDDVCTPGGWQCKYSHANGKTVCDIGILVADGTDEFPNLNPQWVWKADGAGDTDFEAEKGALSDAFKRAAVRWGIGRYLYDLKAPWVAIEAFGRSFKIADHELPRLRALLNGGAVSTADSKRPAASPPAVPVPTGSAPATNGNPPPRNGKTSKDPDWKGPLTKTDLANNMKAFFTALGECQSPEELEVLLDEYQAVVTQCKMDMRGWWDGTGEPRMPQEFVPAETRIAAKRRFLERVGSTLAAG